eukprot:CAMPEP_0198521272 /NCGR_PEP_ID=MMETSP1462-20131121/20826_1 /TAXON_ID=1333877 /ORGANISM="Brandtodinium nutriculum, Strain RCC3387" /LENGTH=446 /DNA_ID=CAMNT_0044250913 /DNA_START=54 /DNA_END=1392 /DNA_ORIENTATION=-
MKGEAQQRFSKSDVESFERAGEGRHVIRSFFLLSLFYMWPYQTFCQTQNFLVEEFPDHAESAGFIMMIASTLPMFVTHSFLSLTGLSRKMSYVTKTIVPSVLVLFVAVYLLVMFYMSEDSNFLLTSLYTAALVGSVAESFVEPAVYDMAGLFPSALTSQMVQAGNGACGLIVSLVQIAARLLSNGLKPIGKAQLEKLTQAFITLMGVLCAALILVTLSIRRTTFYGIYVEQGSGGKSGEGATAQAKSKLALVKASCTAIKHVWPSFLAISITFWTSLTLWPVIPGRTCATPPDGKGTLQTWWFEIIILAFNLSDYIGRSFRGSLSWGALNLSPKRQLFFAIVRAFIFLPLILTGSAPQMYDATIARWVVLVSIVALGLSNGWLSTVSFMRAPKALPPDTPNLIAEQASSVLVIGLFLGISMGCFTAYALGRTLVKDSLGVFSGRSE